MDAEKKLTAEERRRLDRQRFIGLETQRKLLSSLVLITPANGPNTELAKNLVLAGVNVVIYDNAIATEIDFENNFLVGYNQIGMKRGQIVVQRLQEMNPSGKNEFVDKELNVFEGGVTNQFLSRFSMICTSFTNFQTMEKWDQITKESNKPYYNLVCAGQSAFVYISLGNEYLYKEPLTKKNPREFVVKGLSLKDCLSIEDVEKNKKKEYDSLQNIIMIHEAQKLGLNYDPLDKESNSNQDILSQIVDLGDNIKEHFSKENLFRFARLYGVEYCPVYSVIGSIISQQIIKVVENQQEPAMNWLVYDSQEGYATVLQVQKQKELISSNPAV